MVFFRNWSAVAEAGAQVRAAIMHVIVAVRGDEGKIRQRAVGDVLGQFGGGNVVLDQAAVGHIRVIRQRSMTLHVRAGVKPGIAGERQ